MVNFWRRMSKLKMRILCPEKSKNEEKKFWKEHFCFLTGSFCHQTPELDDRPFYRSFIIIFD